jgi:uncharacterized protein with HEPN domain
VSRDESAYIADMLEACTRIAEYVEGFDSERLVSDGRTLDAVVRNLEILGEAAKRVTPATRAVALDLPWRSIAGLRDVLIHDYFGVDAQLVADVALNKVPAIMPALSELLRIVETRSAQG